MERKSRRSRSCDWFSALHHCIIVGEEFSIPGFELFRTHWRVMFLLQDPCSDSNVDGHCKSHVFQLELRIITNRRLRSGTGTEGCSDGLSRQPKLCIDLPTGYPQRVRAFPKARHTLALTQGDRESARPRDRISTTTLQACDNPIVHASHVPSAISTQHAFTVASASPCCHPRSLENNGRVERSSDPFGFSRGSTKQKSWTAVRFPSTIFSPIEACIDSKTGFPAL